MPILGVIEVAGKILGIVAGLGWFSEADWPEELDEAQDMLKQLPGVDIARLDELRAEAHKYYLKHHRALPWDKPRYLRLFQQAIRNWAEGLKEAAERVSPVAALPAFLDKLKKCAPYIGLGGGIFLAAILVWKASKKRGE